MPIIRQAMRSYKLACARAPKRRRRSVQRTGIDSDKISDNDTHERFPRLSSSVDSYFDR